MEQTAYLYSQQELLLEISRPYRKGWVISEAACFERRTKADYLRMFAVYDGSPAIDLLGFRDIEEGLLCEKAAIEYGSGWRFIDYFNRDVGRGKSGMGNLNTVLAAYADSYIDGLFPNLLPRPY
jgi:hypothetical protein